MSPSLNELAPLVDASPCRPPGTWMPKDWAASGARLSVPMRVRFSDEDVDLGFPGEEALGGSRYAKRVYCETKHQRAQQHLRPFR